MGLCPVNCEHVDQGVLPRIETHQAWSEMAAVELTRGST